MGLFQKQPSTETGGQAPTLPSSPASDRHPPTNTGPEKKTGSCKPVSTAEEYGLPNYIFQEGESTWKEKAVTAREKTRQKPINILQQLHRHQVSSCKELSRGGISFAPLIINDCCRGSRWQCRRQRACVSIILAAVHW